MSLLVITQPGEISALLSLRTKAEDRLSVNELVSRVMDAHLYSLIASKHLAVFLFGLVLHPWKM